MADPQHGLSPGTVVTVRGAEHRVERRSGTDQRPLVRLSGIGDREAAAGIGGELVLISEDEAPIEEGEWLAEDLVGCRIEGLGTVTRVLPAPSCSVLEVDDGTLVPLIADAVRSVDPAARRIEVDRRFLGLEAEA